MSIPLSKKSSAVMSPNQNPLQRWDLSATLPAPMTLAEQVRLRIREEMTHRKMSQRDVAGLLGWSQSRVAHLLTGRVEMSVEDVAGFGFALGLQPTEIVRDRGMEFVAEMTPTELRLFERIRQLTPEQRGALYQLLGIVQNDTRHVKAPKR